MATRKCLFIAVMIAVSVVDINADIRSDDMFAYMTINTVRDPKFSEGAELKITANKTILRYMEDAVLSMPTHFKSFLTNFTSPYGDFVVAINGVKDTYYTDGYYWELFVNGQAKSIGVSFYVPQPRDIVRLEFTKDSGSIHGSAQKHFHTHSVY